MNEECREIPPSRRFLHTHTHTHTAQLEQHDLIICPPAPCLTNPLHTHTHTHSLYKSTPSAPAPCDRQLLNTCASKRELWCVCVCLERRTVANSVSDHIPAPPSRDTCVPPPPLSHSHTQCQADWAAISDGSAGTGARARRWTQSSWNTQVKEWGA